MPTRSCTLSLLLLALIPGFACGGEDIPATEGAVAALPEIDPTAAQVLPDIDPTAAAYLRVVTTMKGEPIGDVPFDIQWLEEGSPAKTSSRIGPEGEHIITFDHGSQLVGLVFSPSARTAPRSVKDGTVLAGNRTYTIDVELQPCSIVSGVVLDVEGNPLPGASVLAFLETPESLESQLNPAVRSFSTTDAQGRFRLGGLAPGPFSLEASFEGKTTIWRPCGLIGIEEEIKDLVIMMEPAVIVYGQVTDVDGVAIKNARVTAGRPNRKVNRRTTSNPKVFHYNPRGINVLTGDDGSFQLVGVPESQNWLINVTHKEYKRSIATLEAGQIDIWVELSKGAALRGKITDGNGNPVAQAQIWMLTEEGEPTKFTNLKGQYLFGGLDPLEKVYLIFYRPGSGMKLLGPIAVEAGMPNVDVVLDGGLVIEGVLRDAKGNPVSGAAMRIQGTLPEETFLTSRLPEQFLGRNAVLTGADGSFRFEELYQGVFTVTASVPGKPKVIVLGVEPGITPALALQLKD